MNPFDLDDRTFEKLQSGLADGSIPESIPFDPRVAIVKGWTEDDMFWMHRQGFLVMDADAGFHLKMRAFAHFVTGEMSFRDYYNFRFRKPAV